MRASTRSLWWISGANPGGRNGRWNEATLRRGDLCELENHEILDNLRTVISVERFSRGSVNDTNDLVNLVGWCLDGWWWAADFCEMSPWLCFNQSVNPHLNSYILSNMGGFITCDDSQRKKTLVAMNHETAGAFPQLHFSWWDQAQGRTSLMFIMFHKSREGSFQSDCGNKRDSTSGFEVLCRELSIFVPVTSTCIYMVRSAGLSGGFMA